MRPMTKALLALAAFAAAALAMSPTLYARDNRGESGSMMSGGMMRSMGAIMRMMNHCGAMMQDDHPGSRPNDQWRNHRSPGDKG